MSNNVIEQNIKNFYAIQQQIDQDLRREVLCRSISDVANNSGKIEKDNQNLEVMVKETDKKKERDEDSDSDNSISESLNNYLDDKVLEFG
jgi:hypothetical protein